MTCPNECGMCLQRQHLTSHVEDECVGCKVDDVSDLQTQLGDENQALANKKI